MKDTVKCQKIFKICLLYLKTIQIISLPVNKGIISVVYIFLMCIFSFKKVNLYIHFKQTLKYIGTTSNGFVIWDLQDEDKIDESAIELTLPYGTRNITTKMLQSNSVTLSAHKNFAIAGVR